MSKSAQELRISEAKYRTHREIERSSKAYMRALVPSAARLDVLDVGCGTGVNAEQLRTMGHRVFGVDLSPTAVGGFRKAGFAGAVADASTTLPFAEASFDLVFASEVIEHLADGESFLKELRRVLKPGGRLLLSTPNSAFWVYRIYALAGRTLTEVQHPGHVRFYSKRSLAAQIRTAGFAVEEVSARHIYLLVFGLLARKAEKLLQHLGFQQELRFKTGTYFWHLSRFSAAASPFWADTLIVLASKTNNTNKASHAP